MTTQKLKETHVSLVSCHCLHYLILPGLLTQSWLQGCLTGFCFLHSVPSLIVTLSFPLLKKFFRLKLLLELEMRLFLTYQYLQLFIFNM